MPIPTFTKLGPQPDFNGIVNKVNTLVSELTNIMLSLDSLNVVSISAGTVIVYDLDGGPGTITITKDGMVINNGTFDTFTVDIDGNVTMTSALIRSSLGYPRVELNSSTDIIAAYQDADNHVDINPLSGGAPAINWFAAGAFAASLSTSSAVTQLVSAVQLLLQSTGNMTVRSFGSITLDPSSSLNINGATGQTGTVYVSATSGGVANIPITFTKGLRTS